jgi:hypothetical protein
MHMPEHITGIIGVSQRELAAAHSLDLETQLEHRDPDIASLGGSACDFEQ